MSRLADIAVDAELEPIDLALADLIARLAAPRDGDLLARTAALVSRELRSGHACVDLAEWAGRGLVTGGAVDAFPERETWRRALRDSALVGNGELVTPLVLDDADRCYLHRYWNAERRLAARILAVCGDVLDDVDLPGVAPRLAELFPQDPAAARGAPESPDWQAEAARLVLRRRLAIVSGGPGTGKTTTVARILALLLAVKRDLRIELAAPTGKAAARLTESIRAQASALPVDVELRRIIGELEARTIHRLLGYGGGGGRFPSRLHAPARVRRRHRRRSLDDRLAADGLAARRDPAARAPGAGRRQRPARERRRGLCLR